MSQRSWKSLNLSLSLSLFFSLSPLIIYDKRYSDGQTGSNTGALDSSVCRAPDLRFRGPGLKLVWSVIIPNPPIPFHLVPWPTPGINKWSPSRGRAWGDLQGWRSFQEGGMWQSDLFKYWCHITQLVEHLTKDSGPGFESRSGLSLFLPSRYIMIKRYEWKTVEIPLLF